MIKTLDRYLLKKIFSAFIFVTALILAIVVVIDITEKNLKFNRHDDLTTGMIFQYYLDFIPYVTNMVLPLLVFIAVVFVSARLAAHTEFIAMLSSGISFKRLMRPYFIAALIIAGGSFYLSGWLIPDSNKDRVAFEVKYLEKPFRFTEVDYHLKIGPETYFYMHRYNNNSKVASRVKISTILPNQELKSVVSARRMEWNPEEGSWTLKNWQRRDLNEFGETYSSGNSLDTTLVLTPKDFDSDFRLFETLTINELSEYISRLKERGADNVETYFIEKQVRFASPFAIIILALIGLIVSARKSRGGTGVLIVIGFIIAFGFMLFYILSKSIAEAGSMHPVLAIWLPNITFTIVGLLLYRTLPR